MKLYLTAAGIYAGTQVEAKADGKGWTPEEVPTDKQGLIQYLNALKFSNSVPAPTTPVEPEPVAEGYGGVDPAVKALYKGVPMSEPTSRSIQMDEEWDRLPLARQLDFAARAMENARTAL